jgi:N-acyl-D-aspartate/D-glutamate deacylase
MPEPYDLVLRGGTLYDGSGGPPTVGDLAVSGDRIAALGEVPGCGAVELDVSGLAVSPGFVNMLSWANVSLLADSRAQSDVRQGVTLEIFGEGESMGPLNAAMKREMVERQGDIRFAVAWTTLGEYLEELERRGVAPNVASFVGATTVRVHELGYEDRAPDAAELARMEALVRQAMAEGALGVGASLIYAPAAYAGTDELVALARAAAQSGGICISHLRSEGARLLQGVDELIEIARRSGAAAEVYHLKAAGRSNWGRLEEAISRLEAARAEGLRITADMYPYTAGATGLDAAMPPWVQEGGHEAWMRRLRDPALHDRLVNEMRAPGDDWENLLYQAGSAESVRLTDFKNPALRPLTGRTLDEVARQRGLSPEAAAIDLVLEDDSRVGCVYFLMSEENVRRQLVLPWVSFGSDSGAPSAEGVFLRANPHPRAYGTFARVLGRYVREEGLVPLEEAVRRMSALPCSNLKLRDRGRLAAGFFADLAVFDPASIADRATFEQPHQYAVGMRYVLVNGVPVLSDGEPTGATPGRVVRGPGFRP